MSCLWLPAYTPDFIREPGGVQSHSGSGPLKPAALEAEALAPTVTPTLTPTLAPTLTLTLTLTLTRAARHFAQTARSTADRSSP